MGNSALARRLTLGLLLAAAVAGALGAESAAVARPTPGAHFLGFEGDGITSGDFGSAELRVSRDGRSFVDRGAGSYLWVDFACRPGGLVRRISLAPARGRRVNISRNGSFLIVKRQGRLRFRVRGRFVAPGEARITYWARTRPRSPGRPRICKLPRTRVTLYRDGRPPFRGCRAQRAKTLARGRLGRVFEQQKLSAGSQFFPHVFACLFEANKRFELGRNWDDELVELPRLAGPYVAWASVGCGIDGCDSSISITDLRDGRLVDAGNAACGAEPAPTSGVSDLEPKDNGAVAWIASVPAPPGQARILVCAVDPLGGRLLDSGAAIELRSLELSGSTLTWRNGSVLQSATLN